MAKPVELSAKTVATLEHLARGGTFEQMLDACRQLSCPDIAEAAQEVMTRLVEGKSKIDQIREKYPRAYVKWTEQDDALLEDLLRQGEFLSKIAKALQRGRPGIRSRIVKLGLVGLMHPEDRAELEAERARYRESRPDLSEAAPGRGGQDRSGVSNGAAPATPIPTRGVERSGPTAAQRMGHPLARRAPVPDSARAAQTKEREAFTMST